MSMTANNEHFTLWSYKDSMIRKKLAYTEALLGLVQSWLDNTHDMDGDASFDGLAHAKRIRRIAARIEDTFEEAAIAQMYHDDAAYKIGDGYTAVLRPGQDRRGWDNEAVMASLIDSTVEHMGHRFPFVPSKVLRAIVTEAMWAVHKAGRVEWRSTDLRDHGVDPDEHSRHVTTKASIDLRGDASYIRRTKNRKRNLP